MKRKNGRMKWRKREMKRRGEGQWKGRGGDAISSAYSVVEEHRTI